MLQEAIERIIAAAVLAAQENGSLPKFAEPLSFAIEIKQADKAHFSSPLALKLQSNCQISAMKIANAIAEQARPQGFACAVTVSAPGYLNFFVAPEGLCQALSTIHRNYEASCPDLSQACLPLPIWQAFNRLSVVLNQALEPAIDIGAPCQVGAIVDPLSFADWQKLYKSDSGVFLPAFDSSILPEGLISCHKELVVRLDAAEKIRASCLNVNCFQPLEQCVRQICRFLENSSIYEGLYTNQESFMCRFGILSAAKRVISPCLGILGL